MMTRKCFGRGLIHTLLPGNQVTFRTPLPGVADRFTGLPGVPVPGKHGYGDEVEGGLTPTALPETTVKNQAALGSRSATGNANGGAEGAQRITTDSELPVEADSKPLPVLVF